VLVVPDAATPGRGALPDADEREAVPGQLAEAHVIELNVLGSPAPRGSDHAFYKPGMKRAVLIPDNSTRQRGWMAAVREAARAAIGETIAFVQKPLDVAIVFKMRRPAGHWRSSKTLKASAPLYPTVKPDIDKLARATLDALTGTIWDDDSRIVRLGLVKRYAAPGEEGARITIEEATWL
jgi:Holliday junction resolvase RusA-like endonuclease